MLWLEEPRKMLRFSLHLNPSSILSDPCLNAVGRHSHFKNSGTICHFVRPIRSPPCFTTVGKFDPSILVLTVIVIVVVMAADNPLNSFLLNQSGIESSVDRGAAHVIVFGSNVSAIVVELVKLIDWDVHKE